MELSSYLLARMKKIGLPLPTLEAVRLLDNQDGLAASLTVLDRGHETKLIGYGTTFGEAVAELTIQVLVHYRALYIDSAKALRGQKKAATFIAERLDLLDALGEQENSSEIAALQNLQALLSGRSAFLTESPPLEDKKE